MRHNAGHSSEDHSVEFLLVGKKINQKDKNHFVVTDRGDWVM